MAPRYEIEVEGRPYTVEVEELDASTYEVTVGGKTLRLTAPESVGPAPTALPPPSARRIKGGSGEILAPIPGQVLKVLCAEGDEVQAGQNLMVVESMKMESAISATLAGTVAELRVKEGDKIATGDLLVKIQS